MTLGNTITNTDLVRSMISFVSTILSPIEGSKFQNLSLWYNIIFVETKTKKKTQSADARINAIIIYRAGN